MFLGEIFKFCPGVKKGQEFISANVQHCALWLSENQGAPGHDYSELGGRDCLEHIHENYLLSL